MNNIAILSGDNRQLYILKYLHAHKYNAIIKSNFNFNNENIIICNTPFSKDNEYINCDFYTSYPINAFIDLLKPGHIVFGGNIPEQIIKTGNKQGIIFIDFMKDHEVVWNNAALTAEGLLSKIITNTDFALANSHALIIGFGKCGTNIASRLNSLNCNVTIYDHTPIHLSQAASYGYEILQLSDFDNVLNRFDIIINTVPNKILTDNHMSILKKECVLFEIASKPYGLSDDMAKKYSLSLITSPGLPGTTSPKSAGELIAKSIISYLERTGINGS